MLCLELGCLATNAAGSARWVCVTERPRGCRALVSSRISLTARGPLAEGFFTGLRVLVGAIELSVSMPNTRSKYA